MKLIVYTHSEYSDIFNISKDYIKEHDIDKNDIFVFSDKKIDNCEYKIILYDDDKTYPQKIIQCLSQMTIKDDEHILFTHENDIIIKYNKNDINFLSEKMYEYNIDSIYLGSFDHVNQNISNNNIKKIILNSEKNFIITDKKSVPNLYYIYNVGPHIYKYKIYLDILNKFNHLSYRQIESIDVQTYLLNNNNYSTYMFSINDGKITALKDSYKKLHITNEKKYHIIKNNKYGDIVFDIYKKYKLTREINWVTLIKNI